MFKLPLFGYNPNIFAGNDDVIATNLFYIIMLCYFFQGMAVVNSYMKRKAYPPLVKGLIYTLLLILNPLPIVVTSVGVFDLWVDFRKPRQKNI